MSSSQAMTKTEIDALVQQGVQQGTQKALLAFKSPKFAGKQNATDRSGEQKEGNGNSSFKRAENRNPSSNLLFTRKRNFEQHRCSNRDVDCFDCGEKGHYRGDLECHNPSYQTKRRRQNNDLRYKIGGNSDRKSQQSLGKFRPSSNPKSKEV